MPPRAASRNALRHNAGHYSFWGGRTQRALRSRRSGSIFRDVKPMTRYPYRAFVCMCVVLCAASPLAASAQQPVAPDWKEKNPYSGGLKAHSCVDPSDAVAHRWVQDEPCRLPMHQWPLAGVPSLDERRRWPTYPPHLPGAQGGHTMFWRFPVQPLGPYEAPRHSWR
jgi:hypothetical protein